MAKWHLSFSELKWNKIYNLLDFAFMTNRHWQIHTTLPSLIALMELIFILCSSNYMKIAYFLCMTHLHSFSKKVVKRGEKKTFISLYPFTVAIDHLPTVILLYGAHFHYCCNQVAAEKHCTQKNMVKFLDVFFALNGVRFTEDALAFQWFFWVVFLCSWFPSAWIWSFHHRKRSRSSFLSKNALPSLAFHSNCTLHLQRIFNIWPFLSILSILVP